jgi:hypothetical protein
VLLISHNPALYDLALELSHADLNKLLLSVDENFPTGSMASFRFDGSWKALELHGAMLASFITPSQLPDYPTIAGIMSCRDVGKIRKSSNPVGLGVCHPAVSVRGADQVVLLVRTRKNIV